MRLYAFLIFATCALLARSATVPKLDVSDLQKKLAAVAQEVTKKEVLPIENPPSETESIEQEISVNEVQNNIKSVKIPGIPVKVVVENVKPVVKVDSLDDVELDDGMNIKRVEIDLKNPGEPQRQEHETQNPEHFEEPAGNLKQTVADTHNTIQQGFQGVSQGIQDFFSSNEQLNNIQESIQSLQDNFKEQLNKLNQTVLSFLPQASDRAKPSEQKAFETIDTTLKTLENTFQKTIDKMTEGVTAYALFAPSLRQAAGGAEAGSTTGGTAPPSGGSNNNIFVQYLQALQTTISQGFANVTATIQNTISPNPGNGNNNTFAGPGFISGIGTGIQNIFNQNPPSPAPAGTQSDESGTTTVRPGWPIWQGIQSSLQNILNPGQNQVGQNGQASQPATPGPIAQAIQNNPIVQAVGNFIQPNRPGGQQPAQPEAQGSQPAESAQSGDSQPAASTQEGSNAVPASDPKPDSTEEKKPEEGPIKKIIQNNPIVKGISGAVQKIQSLGNPEKPRDTLEGEAPSTAPEQEKGYIGFGHGAYGGHGSSHHSGDNNDSISSGEVAKSEPVKAEPEVMPEMPKESDKESTEKQPQPAIKTE